MHQSGTFSLTPLKSLTLTNEQGLLTPIFDMWYGTYYWRGIFKISNKIICVWIKKLSVRVFCLESRKGEGEWEVRRSGGRSDRGFCKIEGRIDRRRWKSFGEGEIVRRRRSKVRFFETPVRRSHFSLDLGFLYSNAFTLKLVCWYALGCCFYSLLSTRTNLFSSKPATEWRVRRRWDIDELIGRRRHKSRSHLFNSEPATEWRGRRRWYGTIKS